MKNQKGITLVALVVTIVVLLILAGVTIALVMNSGTSIFGNARKAGTETNTNSVKELISSAFMAAQTNYLARDEEVYQDVTDFLSTDAASKFADDFKKEAGFLNVEYAADPTVTIVKEGTSPDETFKGFQVAKATVTLNGKSYSVTIDTTATVSANRIVVTEGAAE